MGIVHGVLALTNEDIERAVRIALAEDIGAGDATTLALVPEESQAFAVMAAREPLVVCGLKVAETAFRLVSAQVVCEFHAEEGARVEAGATLLEVQGPARALLTAERVALNFVQRLSGVATLTRRFVDVVGSTPVKILDTRKTTPGLRVLEKYAVTCGGGQNHRMGLFDQILIKDNHLATLSQAQPNAVAAAVARARARYPALKIEVEADTVEQAKQAADAGADLILLDNFGLPELRAAVKLIHGRAHIEASGGVTLETVRAIAETGVDSISVGALTHSARAVDIGLDFIGPAAAGPKA